MQWTDNNWLIPRLIKPIVFLLCLVPFFLLAWDTYRDQLGANPIETLTHTTGDWVLRFLLITLSITPLRRISGWTWLLRFRRMFGLYAFFYVLLHFTIWFWLDHGLMWEEIVEDIAKRPYVTVGFTAFVMLIPLAVTSTKGMMRRLGSGWKKLHRLVYLAAFLGVLHFIWLVKADLLEPMIYAVIYVVLMILRMPHKYQGKPRLA